MRIGIRKRAAHSLFLILVSLAVARLPASATPRWAPANPPLSFEANHGQADPSVRYLARGRGYSLLLGEDGFALHLAGTRDQVGLRLAGARCPASLAGEEPLPARSNYFIGSDPERWLVGVPHHGSVRYREVYPGVDLVLHGRDGELEYDFVLAAGADPEVIRIAFDGVRELAVDAGGDLRLDLAGGTLLQRAPTIYQEVDGKRRLVAGRYRLLAGAEVGFELDGHDPGRPLVIDPVLVYASFLGGGGNDRGYGVAVDAAGSVYVTGDTASALDFPTQGPFQASSGGQTDAFVTRYDPAAGALVFSTYLGGSNNDRGYAIALDGAGNIYVTGETGSPDFPPQGTLQPTPGGAADAFVSVLVADGSALVYSTYLGGGGNDRGRALAVSAAGRAYVAGETASNNFPPANPLQAARAGGDDAFLSVIETGGASLVFSTYFGGNGNDRALGVAADAAGVAVLTGDTESDNLLIPTPDPVQRTPGGGRDAFLARIDTAVPVLVHTTYLGGADDERGSGVQLAADGEAVVVGETSSDDFPTASPWQRQRAGANDVFLARIDASGSLLLFSTFLGGGGQDRGYAVALEPGPARSAWITGETGSDDFPTVSPTQPLRGGAADVFVARLETSAAPAVLVHSTYLGDTGNDRGRAIALGPCGAVVLAGETASANFPVVNALQPTFGGGNDAFLAISACPAAQDLAIAKDLAPGQSPTPETGQPVAFSVRVVNVGSVAVAGAMVDDRLEACFERLGLDGTACDPAVVSCAGAGCAAATCQYTATGFAMTGLSLDPGASVVLTVNAIAGANPGVCTNAAETSDADPDVESARAAVTITLVPRFAVRKTAIDAQAPTGGSARFLIEVDNSASIAPADCTFTDTVNATGCMTLLTCDLTTPLMPVLCSPPDFLSSPGFVVPAGGTQQIRFTATAGPVETSCLNQVSVTCSGVTRTAEATLLIANGPSVCPLRYGDVAFPPASPTSNWPKVADWVYTAPCPAGGAPQLGLTLVPTAASGDLAESFLGTAGGTLRLYQVDCDPACAQVLQVYKNLLTGKVAIDLR